MTQLGTRPRRSRFAPEVLPDGRRRFSHEAVVARRVLLVASWPPGVGGGVVVSRLPGDDAEVVPASGAAPPPPLRGHAAGGSRRRGRTVAHGRRQPVGGRQQAAPLDPRDYAPSLAVVDGKEVAAVIAPDLRSLLQDARRDGVSLSVTSGYRSFQRQTSVHDRRRPRRPGVRRERVGPGYSEHQTGLAVDFGWPDPAGCLLKNCFGQTPESEWLRAHAGRYGFLLRYPEGATGVTGYDPEPWHWRWVGTDLVQRVAERGTATLEEFFGISSGGAAYADVLVV